MRTRTHAPSPYCLFALRNFPLIIQVPRPIIGHR
jgi:hypothetical protein